MAFFVSKLGLFFFFFFTSACRLLRLVTMTPAVDTHNRVHMLAERGPAHRNVSLQHHQWSKTPQSTFKKLTEWKPQNKVNIALY